MTKAFKPEEASELLDKFQTDHRFFCKHVLGIRESDLLDFQHKIAESPFKYSRVAIKSCHDIGKTFTGALAIFSYFMTHPNTTVISTAPTTNLLQNQLWAEIRSHKRRANVDLNVKILDGKPFMSKHEKWFAVGFVPRLDLSQAQSDFQGFHNKQILIVFDEASGIPRKIWEMAESMMTSANVHFLALGNPTDPSGQFADCFKSSMWTKMSVNCFDVPNISENNIRNMQDLRTEVILLQNLSEEERHDRISKYKTPYPFLLTLQFVVSAYEKWGEDSPWFQSRILAEFPIVSDDTLISPKAITESINREIEEDNFEYLGVDVARFGKDKSIIYHMKGMRCVEKYVYEKKDTSQLTGIIKRLYINNKNISKIGVDDTGVGGGVTDQLKSDPTITRLVNIIPVNFGCRSNEPDKYADLKSEIFYLLKLDIETSIKLLDCDITNSQLSSIKFKLTPKGQIKIESKEDMKKRGLPSPDFADGLAICNYMRHESMHVGSFNKYNLETKNKISWQNKEEW